jgi:hypothetical protein
MMMGARRRERLWVILWLLWLVVGVAAKEPVPRARPRTGIKPSANDEGVLTYDWAVRFCMLASRRTHA